MATETISSALGLSDEWFDSKLKSVRSNLGQHEKISDLILSEANNHRDECFGDVNGEVKLSEYEVKLVTLGYIISEVINKQINFSGLIGLEGSGLPKEIQEIISQIIKRKMEEED